MAIGSKFGNRVVGSLFPSGSIANTVASLGEKGKILLEINALKKQIAGVVQEKAKMFEFIGMEVYDLYTAGKLKLPEVESFYLKIDGLDKEIKRLVAEKAEKENSNKNINGSDCVCGCGCKLTSNLKFCPQCGAKVETSTIMCTCGIELDKKLKFCSNCGTQVESLLSQGKTNNTAAISESKDQVECVCGAVVDANELMCMECGRRVIKKI